MKPRLMVEGVIADLVARVRQRADRVAIPGERGILADDENGGRDPVPGEALHAYVGHAGWGAGQLADELRTGSWITCSAEPQFIFDMSPDEIWETALSSLGSEFARLASMPGDPRVN